MSMNPNITMEPHAETKAIRDNDEVLPAGYFPVQVKKTEEEKEEEKRVARAAKEREDLETKHSLELQKLQEQISSLTDRLIEATETARAADPMEVDAQPPPPPPVRATPLPKQYRTASKMPTWSAKKFRPEDDVSAFLGEIQAKMDMVPGIMSNEQQAHFMYSCLDDGVKALLKIQHTSRGTPDPKDMKHTLRQLFSDKSGIVNTTDFSHWAAQFAGISMKPRETWQELYYRVAAKGAEFQESEQNTGPDAIAKAEDRMWEVITYRSNETVKRILLKAQEDWKKNKEEMFVPGFKFRSAYAHLQTHIPSSHNSTTNNKREHHSNTKNNNYANSKKDLCKFDPKCTRAKCRFRHTAEQTISQEGPVTKRSKIVEKCEKCYHFHPGPCADCYKCNPEKRPKGKFEGKR